MVRRRPRARNSIGIAGQRQRIDIRGSEYGIYRQPDRLVVHEEPGAEHVTVEGNERHLHFHTGPRPGPERPFFNFEEMAARLQESILKRIGEEGIGFGKKNRETGAWSGPEKPKYVSKWGGIAKNIAHPMDNVFGKNTRNFKGHNWLPVRPLKLADAMFSTKKAGRIRFWRDKRGYKKALALNERFAPRTEQINEEFRAEASAALAELQNAVREGRINRENRNFYFEKYEKAVREAEKKFQQSVSRLISDYMREWKGK